MGQIVLKNIDMSLDPKSIKDAIDAVKKFKNDLSDALAELARSIVEERGKGIVQMYIAQFPAIMSSTLHDRIHAQYDKSAHEGTISTDVEYAVLVEYGTGIVGQNNPHPGLGDPDWTNPEGTTIGDKTYSSYDQNNHGEAGWWYPAPWGWYEASDGKMLAWTKGMPSRPFMYMTMREIELEVEKEGGRIIAQYIP